MQTLVIVALLVTLVSGDVSHLFNRPPSRSSFQPTFGHGQSTSPQFVAITQPRREYNANVQHGYGQQIPILKLDYDITPEGSYVWGYQTGNGISAQEQGTVSKTGPDTASKSVHGSYEYTGLEGGKYGITYEADENGFRAYGPHIPTPPPIPEAILRSLKWNEAHAGRGEGSPNRYQSY